jgi:hypothetical protein
LHELIRIKHYLFYHKVHKGTQRKSFCLNMIKKDYKACTERSECIDKIIKIMTIILIV